MKLYLFSLGAGVLVGVIYHLIGVRSPAPPLVALVGLLGILGGEQLVPVSKQYFSAALHAAMSRASHEATAASGTWQHGISRVMTARKIAGNEETRS
jgi:XapX domain-containing protein